MNNWLSFAVLAAAISTFGALAGVLIKDYFFARSFERWKQQETLEQLYQRFRDPLTLASRELADRIGEIVSDYPTVFLTNNVWNSRPAHQLENNLDDPYYRRYKLVSTLYRLSAVLGWVELYRQEITFLHSKSNAHAQALERAVGHFRSDFADGHINEESDWYQWRDTLIFREELRAIGESMIESRATVRTVMGYGRYIECLEASSPNPVQRWAPVVLNFFVELETNGKDFRRVRMQRAYLHLFALLSALNPSLLNEHMQGLRNTINEANKHVRQYEPPS